MAEEEEEGRKNTCVPVSVLLFLLAQIKSKGLSRSLHNPNSIPVTICEQRTIRKMCKQMI